MFSQISDFYNLRFESRVILYDGQAGVVKVDGTTVFESRVILYDGQATPRDSLPNV